MSSEPEETDASEAWVTVARYTSAHEAHLAQTVLGSRGIHARVLDAETVGVAWILSNAVGGVRLQVPRGAQTSAADVLATAGAPDPIDEAALAEEALAAAPPVVMLREPALAGPSTNAKRALGAALLGFVVPVLPNLYSLYVAVPELARWSELPSRARGWLAVALAIDLLVALLLMALLG